MCLKNRLRRQWEVTKNPALKAHINRLHMLEGYLLSEWRKDQWSHTLESFDSEDQS
jgi:hypothetical protein